MTDSAKVCGVYETNMKSLKNIIAVELKSMKMKKKTTKWWRLRTTWDFIHLGKAARNSVSSFSRKRSVFGISRFLDMISPRYNKFRSTSKYRPQYVSRSFACRRCKRLFTFQHTNCRTYNETWEAFNEVYASVCVIYQPQLIFNLYLAMMFVTWWTTETIIMRTSQ